MTQPRFVITRSSSTAQPPPPPVAPPAESSGCGCGSRPKRPGRLPAVRVDGVEIEPEAIAQETQNHPGSDPMESWTAAARALAVRALLLAEARRRQLEPAPEAVGEARYETEEESLVRQVLEDAVEPQAPSDAECRRVYEGLKDRFVTPTLFEASHILIEPAGDEEAAWDEARGEALGLLAQVGDSPAAFAEAASACSACPTSNQGGSLGQVRRGELAEPVQAAIEALREGETGKAPVRSQFGWHLVRLERRIPGHALPFEIVQPKIRDMLEARAWAMGATQFVAELAAGAAIEGVTIAPPDGGFGACEEGRGC